MALTTEQEAKIALLLEAFDNAKAIGSLPVADSATLLTALWEVVQGGVSKKATIEDVMNLYGATAAYGIKINISTGVVTRVGNAMLHRTLPIQNRIRGCLLSDAGAVNSYLPALDWTGADRTGASGQVMVEVPLHYFRCWVDGGYAYIMISEYKLPATNSFRSTM